MKEKTYTLKTLEQICDAASNAAKESRQDLAEFFQDHEVRDDGLWVHRLTAAESKAYSREELNWLEWHPQGNLDLPALKFPFTARQLAAFSFDDRAQFLLDLAVNEPRLNGPESLESFEARFGFSAGEADTVLRMEEPPMRFDASQLAHLGDNAAGAIEVLRDMHHLLLACADMDPKEAIEWLHEESRTSPGREATSRFSAQESLILEHIRSLGFEPKQLPKNQPGESGVKSKIRDALGTKGMWTGTTVFVKAWERLAARGDIAYTP